MKILVAVDGSEASAAALHTMKTRPWPEETEVRVLSVSEPVYLPPLSAPDPTAVAYPYPAAAMLATNEQISEVASKVARRGAEELRALGLRVATFEGTGDPRHVIVQHAKDWNADLIILGSHGRTGIKRWMLGSVAESVVRHAPCSVEVARTKPAPS